MNDYSVVYRRLVENYCSCPTVLGLLRKSPSCCFKTLSNKFTYTCFHPNFRRACNGTPFISSGSSPYKKK